MPVDDGETSNTAELQLGLSTLFLGSSRGDDEAPKSDDSVTSRDDGGAGHAARAEGEQLVVVVGRARHGAVDDDVAAVRRPRLGRQQRGAAFQKVVAADVGEAAVAEDAEHGAA